jgi:hypothetical protein
LFSLFRDAYRKHHKDFARLDEISQRITHPA